MRLKVIMFLKNKNSTKFYFNSGSKYPALMPISGIKKAEDHLLWKKVVFIEYRSDILFC